MASNFGLGIDPSMVKVSGRILEAPQLEYAEKQRIQPNKGAWDMGRGGFMFKKSVKVAGLSQQLKM